MWLERNLAMLQAGRSTPWSTPFLKTASHIGIGVCLLLAGCTREEPVPAPTYTSKPNVADKLTHYIFTVHPLHNPQLLHQKFQPLMQYLDNHIPGVQFDLDASSDYADYERKLRAGQTHFSLPNPYHAALARDWGYHVIAKMSDDSLFRGVFVVRKDSPIREPADLRGKVVSYPAPTALAAAMLPQLYLQDRGIDVETELTNRYVGTHNSAIMNAYLGQSAAGVTWPVAWKAFQEANPKEAAELYLIWQTPNLIQNAIIVRNDVPADLANTVRGLLTGLQDTPAGREILDRIDTSSFETADDKRFDVVLAFLKEYKTRVKKEK
jgi:phosphonate transport system substrate-binding protein